MFSFGAIDVMEITLLLPKYTLKAHFCGCWADIKVGVCVRERERIFAILKSIDWGLSAPSTHELVLPASLFMVLNGLESISPELKRKFEPGFRLSD